MKTAHKLWMSILLALCLAGCGMGEDPYMVDTVIQIPVDPTEATTEPAATEEPTEPPTEATGPEPTQAAKPAAGTSSGGKPSSSASKPAAAATEPPTEAPTEPPTEPEVVWTELPTEPPYEPETYVTGQLEYDILSAVNSRRQAEGAGALTLDSRLSGLAAVRAREAARVWSHTRPDGRGWETVLTDDGYSCSLWAEHLIYVTGTPDAAGLAEGWLGTPNNAASLLDGANTTAGIGVYENNGYTYVAFLVIG